ncbi:MAG: low specificity L-threonine aldolase [Burkholderiaceae bacterium]|nr:low specificity L-threonine aldolase [Burkholderiaceae bacterium]
MDFGSENTSPVHPAFVEALVSANKGYATNFESEGWTERSLVQLRAFFETDDLWAFSVSTGTAANGIALGAMVPRYGSILCHSDAHTVTDECGAPEMFSAGARQVLFPGEHGRLSPEALEIGLSEARIGVVHAVQPSVLSLTNLTEAGTAYNPDQLATLTKIAHKYKLGVHLDGARFANAVVSIGATPAELSWKAGVEVLTLGTTKSGSYGVETIVSFTPKYNTELGYLRKRSGHLAPKSRFLAAQVLAYLDDDLWRKNAVHANRAALRLSSGLIALEGVTLVHPTQGNEVFVSMPDVMTEALVNAGCKFQQGWRPRPKHHRFVMSWFTSDEEIDQVLEICRVTTTESVT